MDSCTLRKMLETDCYKNLLQLKVSLVRSKNVGMIFFQENVSELTFDEPFELYYVLTKGNITYQHAFPIPVHYYKPWMRKKTFSHHLYPYYRSYYETKNHPVEGFLFHYPVL
jgi:hypothetical protein